MSAVKVALTPDEIEELATLLYVHIQERIEEPDARHIVATCAPFGEVNHYTQKVFRDGVERVVAAYESLLARRPPRPTARRGAKHSTPPLPAAGVGSSMDGS